MNPLIQSKNTTMGRTELRDVFKPPSEACPLFTVKRLSFLCLLMAAWMTSLSAGFWSTAHTEVATWLVVADRGNDVNSRAIVLRTGGKIGREMPAIGTYTVTGDSEVGERLRASPSLRIIRIGDSDVHAAGTTIVAPPRPEFLLSGPSARFAEQTLTLPFVDDDFYFAGQWALDAIDAPEAWATGQRGRGVRVAVLDTGIDPTHPDLAANVNVALAKSFVPGQTWDVSTDLVQDFDHGTHVSGIIAAADNAFGIIGVAPEAEIIPVQVLRRPTGTGPPDAVIAGIIYAADVGADVINLSLSYSRLHQGGINTMGTEDPSDDVAYTAADAAALATAFARATAYAHARGVTVITGTANDAIDGDHDRDLFLLPRDAPHAITVAATGPLGWATDPGTDLDVPAFYTNYGQSVVELSAPGGNIDFGLLGSGAVCTVTSGPVSVTLPCWMFDGVLSTAPVNGGYLYEFRRGTSMATAHVSGVAALIIGKNSGRMNPAEVRARLRSSAEDLGKAGHDDFYGIGRVNAFEAVR
jgi:lantibiotic leader peptide-processing serine protease